MKWKRALRAIPTSLAVFIAVCLVIISLLVLTLYPPVPEAPPILRLTAAGDSNFTNLVASGDITSGDDITAGDDLNVTDDAIVSGDLDAIENLDAGGWMRYTRQTVQTVANDGWLTATGTYQPITAAGNIGFSKISTASRTTGDILILQNEYAASIVITDENDTNLAGDRTLGNGDNLTLIYSGTAWYELGATNN